VARSKLNRGLSGILVKRVTERVLWCTHFPSKPSSEQTGWVLLSAGAGAQRHTFIFGQKRGKPGGADYWLGVEAKKGERIIPRSCPARFRLMFCSIVGCVVLDRLKRKNVLAFI
jgi:hypothetical protein